MALCNNLESSEVTAASFDEANSSEEMAWKGSAQPLKEAQQFKATHWAEPCIQSPKC